MPIIRSIIDKDIKLILKAIKILNKCRVDNLHEIYYLERKLKEAINNWKDSEESILSEAKQPDSYTSTSKG